MMRAFSTAAKYQNIQCANFHCDRLEVSEDGTMINYIPVVGLKFMVPGTVNLGLYYEL